MKVRGVVIFLLIMGYCSISAAGPFTDEMSKCIVRNTSPAEQTYLVKWIFAAVSAHPEVQSMSNINSNDIKQYNEKVAGIMTELLTERCYSESKQAIKYEGVAAIETSFGVLGEVAMQGLFAHPNVNQVLENLSSYLDESKFQNLIED